MVDGFSIPHHVMTLYDVIQANRKDLQRFLGLNDDNEMVSAQIKTRREKKLNLTKTFLPPGLHSQCAQTTEAGFSHQGASDAIRYSFFETRCSGEHLIIFHLPNNKNWGERRNQVQFCESG